MPFFQEYEFHSYRSADDHLEGQGVLREQHTYQLRLGIAAHFGDPISMTQLPNRLLTMLLPSGRCNGSGLRLCSGQTLAGNF